MDEQKKNSGKHTGRRVAVIFLLIIVLAGCFVFCMQGGLFRILSSLGMASTPETAIPSVEEQEPVSEVVTETEESEVSEVVSEVETAFAVETDQTIHIAQTPEEDTLSDDSEDSTSEASQEEDEEGSQADPGTESATIGIETTDDGELIDPNLISTHMILVDPDAGTILAEKDAAERIVPASMTKIMTLLVAVENLSESQLNDTVTVSQETCDYVYLNDCSVAGFCRDEQVPVRDLLYGMILPSGADAVLETCDYIAGSQEAFVELMNQKAEELGISETTHFVNAIGLYDEDHYSTCYDMAVILHAAMQNELAREVLGTRTYTTTKTEQNPEGLVLSNWFLRRIEDKETGAEVVGAKTGYVRESGSCAASYETREDGTNLICVTVGSTSSWKCIYDHIEVYDTYGR